MPFWLVVLLVYGLSYEEVLAQTPSKSELTQKLLHAIDNVSTLRYRFKKYERHRGKLLYEEMDVRMARNPFRVYLFQYTPNKGAEVLYNIKADPNKALVNPGKFPYVNLSLDPYGSILLEGQHHPLLHSGFDRFAEIIRVSLKKYQSNLDAVVTIEGTLIWNQIECYKVSLVPPNFSWTDYTVKNGEDLWKIEKNLGLSAHMILEKNSQIKHYRDVKPGQIIKIPTDYAKKTVLYINKKNFLPIVQFIYDEQGLFEQYEHHNLELNPTLLPDEFKKECPSYNF